MLTRDKKKKTIDECSEIAQHIFFTHVRHSIAVKAVSACIFITSETATDSQHWSFCHASAWQIRLDPLSRTPNGRQIKRLRRSQTAVVSRKWIVPGKNVWTGPTFDWCETVWIFLRNVFNIIILKTLFYLEFC